MGSKRQTDCILLWRGNTWGGLWRDKGILLEVVLRAWLVEGWPYEAGGREGSYRYWSCSEMTRVLSAMTGVLWYVGPVCVSNGCLNLNQILAKYWLVWLLWGSLMMKLILNNGEFRQKSAEMKRGMVNSMRITISTFSFFFREVLCCNIGWSCCV